MNIAAILPAPSTDAVSPGAAPSLGAEFPELFAALLSVPTPSVVGPPPVAAAPGMIAVSLDALPAGLDAAAEPKPEPEPERPDADADADANADSETVATALAILLPPPVPTIAVAVMPVVPVDSKPATIALREDAPSARSAAAPAATAVEAAPPSAPAPPMPRLIVRGPGANVTEVVEPARPAASLEPKPPAGPDAAGPPVKPVAVDPVGVPVIAPDATPRPVAVQKSAAEPSPALPMVPAPPVMPLAPAPAVAAPVPAPATVAAVPVSDVRTAMPPMQRPARSRDSRADIVPQSTLTPATPEAHDATPSLATVVPRAFSHDPAPAVTARIVDTGPGSFDLATDRLGSVRVAIEARDTRVGVQFTVDTSAAANLLGAQPSRLADAVATSGNRFDGVSVDVRSGGGNDAGGGRQPAEPRERPRSAAPEARPIPRALRADRYA